MSHSRVRDERKNIFFTNLLMLGFNPSYYEAKHNIPFHKEMFAVPNKKGFQIVTYFLFSKLNEVCGNEFSILWPLSNIHQETEFRRLCFVHLVKISKEDTGGVQFPKIFKTFFLSPGGDRFYEVYVAFSCYVLQRIILHGCVCQPINRPTKQNIANSKTDLQIVTLKIQQQIAAFLQQSISNEQKLQKITENFVATYRQLKQELAEANSLLQDELSSFIQKWPIKAEQNLSQKNLVCKCLAHAQAEKSQVLTIWHTLDECFSKDKAFWKIIGPVIEPGNARKVLNGKDLFLDVPEILKPSLEKIGFNTADGDYQPSIERFLTILQECLKYYLVHFRKETQCQHKCLIQKLESSIEILEPYQKMLKSDREKLQNQCLPDIVKSIKELECLAYSEDSSEKLPIDFPPDMPSFTICEHKKAAHILPENILELAPLCTENTPSTSDSYDMVRDDVSSISLTLNESRFSFDTRQTLSLGESKERNFSSSRQSLLTTDSRANVTVTSGYLTDPSVNNLDAFDSFSLDQNEIEVVPKQRQIDCKSKFVDEIVSSLLPETYQSPDVGKELQILDDSFDTPDFLGEKAFSVHEKIVRTPQILDASKRQKKLNSENFQDKLVISKGGSFLDYSGLGDDDFLDSTTMPHAPDY